MLSYRHAFHAGNYADVFKHLCQVLLLNKLTEKAKPLCYVDTHSAAGLYDLGADMANKTAEYSDGIDKLLQRAGQYPEITDYLALISQFRDKDLYPGSPAIAAHLLREQDKLILMELHNNEVENLRANMGRDPRVAIHHRDGFEGTLAIAPPEPKRGMVLIDPPYEQAREYQDVVNFIQKLHKKWPVGVVALWYPLLAEKRNKAPAMLDALAKVQPASLFIAECWVKPQPQELGMYGSGMAFINLPWQVDQQIAQLLPILTSLLGQTGAGYRTEWLIEPA